MGRLFGTDGARGIANRDITCELALGVGRAVATLLSKGSCYRPRVLIGGDTRKSTHMLISSLASGLCSAGADVLMIGVVPTPAVAYLVKEYGYDAGIMISASHNPCEYNGIKIFKSDGYKLPDKLEEQIENFILDDIGVLPPKIGGEIGNITISRDAVYDYVEHIATSARCSYKGIKAAIDCANGSASVTAAELFGKLGLNFDIYNSDPDGVNINKGCGSTHIDHIAEIVRKDGYNVGFAFDGDADRLLCVDEDGNLVDGDKIMAILAKHFKDKNMLNNNTVVTTVMSNMGFFEMCRNHGINTVQTKVGDRYVLENMLENGYNFGGEQSGHIIFHDFASTGDGQLTAVQVLNVMCETGKSLKELASVMEVFPQVLINVQVSALGKLRLDTDREINHAIEYARKALGDSGRVLVRASGTEPLVRVMLEGRDEKQINELGMEIAEVVKERLI
jgi:phosphoglucosamine mutase